MIRCLLAVCAESVIRDAPTNLVSVVNILDEIQSQAFPVLVPKLSCLFMFDRHDDDPPESDVVLTFTHTGTQLFQGAVHLDFQGKLRLRSMLILQGFVVPTPGTIKATITQGENILGFWEFPATAVGGPQLKLPIEPVSSPI